VSLAAPAAAVLNTQSTCLAIASIPPAQPTACSRARVWQGKTWGRLNSPFSTLPHPHGRVATNPHRHHPTTPLRQTLDILIYNWAPYFTLKDSLMDSYDGPDMV